MGFACPICSEKLEKLPAEAQSRGNSRGEINISATPCGHIFHAYCIQKWLTGNMPGNKLCPCCRKDVPKLRCLSLFPNQVDDSILDDSMLSQPSSSSGVSAPAPCNHGALISSLKSQITRIEAEMKEKDQLYELLSSDHETTLERFRNEKHESDMWMMKAKQFESYQDVAHDFQKRMEKAERQLKNYTYIESALKGVEGSIDEDKRNFPPNSTSIESLIQTKHILSRELRNVSKRLDDLKSSSESIRSEKMKLRIQCDKLSKDLKELRNMYEIARLNGRVRSTSPVAGPSSMCDSTPKGFRNKRRFQESLPHRPQQSANFAFIESPGVDSDVDLFPSAVKAKKTKSSTSQDAKKDHGKETKQECRVGKLPITSVTSVPVSKDEKRPVNLNATITLSDGSCDELLDLDDEDDFRIRGNVPGAPLPIARKNMKSLQERSKNPVLGISAPRKKVFKFTKK